MSSVTAVPLRPVKRGYLVWLWLGVALALISGFALARAGDTGVQVTPSGLRYQVLESGQASGPRPTNSDLALVNYEGRLPDGTVFDRSQQPTPFPVAPGATVPGFSEALKLMPKGAKYRFWLSPELAYGDRQVGPIPPNSTLRFDVEMVDFRSQAEVMREMQMQQMMGQGDPSVPTGPGGAGR